MSFAFCVNSQPAGPVQQPRGIVCSDVVASSYAQASGVLQLAREAAFAAVVAEGGGGEEEDEAGYGRNELLRMKLERCCWPVTEWSGSNRCCLEVINSIYQSRPAGTTSPWALVASVFDCKGERRAVRSGTEGCPAELKGRSSCLPKLGTPLKGP